jgi:hypothetical protein
MTLDVYSIVLYGLAATVSTEKQVYSALFQKLHHSSQFEATSLFPVVFTVINHNTNPPQVLKRRAGWKAHACLEVAIKKMRQKDSPV